MYATMASLCGSGDGTQGFLYTGQTLYRLHYSYSHYTVVGDGETFTSSPSLCLCNPVARVTGSAEASRVKDLPLLTGALD